MIYAKISTLIIALITVGSTDAQDLRKLSLLTNLSLRSLNQSPQTEEGAVFLRSGLDAFSRDASKIKVPGLRLGKNAKIREFTIGTSSGGPKVELLDPANGDVITTSSHTFKYKVTESQGKSGTINAGISVAWFKGAPYTEFADVFPGKGYLCPENDPYSNDWTICQDATNLVDGSYKWFAKATDVNGKEGKSEEAIFTVKLQGPKTTCTGDSCFDYEGKCVCLEVTSATKCEMSVDGVRCSCCEHNGEELTGMDCPFFGKVGQCTATAPTTCESPCFDYEGNCLCAKTTSSTECDMTVNGQKCSCCKHDGTSITAADCPIIGKFGQCSNSPFPF